MNTPICDFVRDYAQSGTMRLHMPGHKGVGAVEALDITEISGADSLYEAEGIIAESERNASRLFGCPTFYSAEGSSQCIRAMLYLATRGGEGRVLAGRNAHRVFLSAAALLDLEVEWLWGESYLSCDIDPAQLEEQLSRKQFDAVYVTSPDYLGNMLDIEALAAVCHRHGTRLLVDNAHGAYLKFLPRSRHPMDLGADLCCDSAHKTLPVLTGGAYLHVKPEFAGDAKDALALFGSTSPSYLILQSLDGANRLLADPAYIGRLVELSFQLAGCREELTCRGINAQNGQEPLKLTIYPKLWGYTGAELAEYLRTNGIECEFADPDFLVLMFTPAISAEDIRYLTGKLLALPRRTPICAAPPMPGRPERVMSIRQAVFAKSRTVPVEESLGKVLAAATVACPPAVPIVTCGERIDQAALECFRYYGIQTCRVVDEA